MYLAMGASVRFVVVDHVPLEFLLRFESLPFTKNAWSKKFAESIK